MGTVTAIIQARLGSTRLAGKTLMDLRGKPLLGHLIERVRQSKFVKEIIVATTVNERDNAIAFYALENNLKLYRGSEEDVLDRFYQAATQYQTETIVRVTPDCPMQDPHVMDEVISVFGEGGYDYVSNTMKPTFPDGLDTEVFSFAALRRAWNDASLPSEREHVTSYIYGHPDLFRLFNVESGNGDLSQMRWTVDTQRDYEFVKRIFELMDRPGDLFYMEDVLGLLKEHPQLLTINQGILRNEGYAKSLLKDRKHDRQG